LGTGPHSSILLFWWRWALLSPDGVAPSRIVCVSVSVNLPLHHKVQKLSSGTGSPGWSQQKGRKMVVVVAIVIQIKTKLFRLHIQQLKSNLLLQVATAEARTHHHNYEHIQCNINTLLYFVQHHNPYLPTYLPPF